MTIFIVLHYFVAVFVFLPYGVVPHVSCGAQTLSWILGFNVAPVFLFCSQLSYLIFAYYARTRVYWL